MRNLNYIYIFQLLGSFIWGGGCIFLCLLYMSLEKAVAPHSSTLAWKIPWTEEPGRLQSTGSLRVGHDWATSLSLCTFMHWRRKWQPTPVFLLGESQGLGSLVGCHLWGRTESDTMWLSILGANKLMSVISSFYVDILIIIFLSVAQQ